MWRVGYKIGSEFQDKSLTKVLFYCSCLETAATVTLCTDLNVPTCSMLHPLCPLIFENNGRLQGSHDKFKLVILIVFAMTASLLQREKYNTQTAQMHPTPLTPQISMDSFSPITSLPAELDESQVPRDSGETNGNHNSGSLAGYCVVV